MSEFLPKEKIDAIVQRIKTGGGEIVKLLKTGSAYYVPGKAVAEMVEGILRDQKRVLPVITHFSGQYGFDSIFAGAPVILGRGGVEKMLEIELTDEEKAAYQTSLQAVKDGIESAKQFIN